MYRQCFKRSLLSGSGPEEGHKEDKVRRGRQEGLMMTKSHVCCRQPDGKRRQLSTHGRDHLGSSEGPGNLCAAAVPGP